MKSLTMNLFLLLIFSVSAATTIAVKLPLKNQDIYKVIYQSAQKFLAYEGEEISGGLEGELTDPTIVSITKEGDETLEVVVKYEAFFITYDHDFGDPVHEEFTGCTSILKKVNGSYSETNTTTKCNFDPSVDIDEEPKGHPCCEDGRPIVDSNHCFDYYEEGAQFCAQYSEYDYDDY